MIGYMYMYMYMHVGRYAWAPMVSPRFEVYKYKTFWTFM